MTCGCEGIRAMIFVYTVCVPKQRRCSIVHVRIRVGFQNASSPSEFVYCQARVKLNGGCTWDITFIMCAAAGSCSVPT